MRLYDPTQVVPDRCILDNGTMVLIICDPTLPWGMHKQLHDLCATMHFEWNAWHKCWEIWHRRAGTVPYRYAIIRNEDGSYRHPDNRVFRQLRYDMWYSRHIMQHMWDELNEVPYREAKREAQIRDKMHQFTKQDLAPLGVSLLEAGSSSYGKSRWMFPGMGESRMHGGTA